MENAKLKITTVGSALIDVFIKSNNFIFDEHRGTEMVCSALNGKMEVEDFILTTGGGGSNTAVGFARQGFDTEIVSELGRDQLALLVEADLTKEKVSSQFLVREKKEKTGGSVILVSLTGERSVLVHRGASSMIDPTDIPTDIFASDLIHVSSISGQSETFNKIIDHKVKHKFLMSWNPGMSDIQKLIDDKIKMTAQLDYFFVNMEEWEALGKFKDKMRFYAKMIIVTDGDKGGKIFDEKNKHYAYQAEKVKSIDATGAGDAFVVGFLSAQMRGEGLAGSIELATKNSASVVQYFGGKEGLLKN